MSSAIRMQADDFFHAYMILRESNELLANKVIETNGKPLASPIMFSCCPTFGVGVVCLAFSIELYIKDLHFVISEKAPPQGHNILELFRELPDNIQEEIRHRPSIQKIVTFYSMQKFPLYIPKDKNKKPITDILEQKIFSISDAFEKWRYSYESIFPDSGKGNSLKYDTSFALDFVEAVKSVADKQRK